MIPLPCLCIRVTECSGRLNNNTGTVVTQAAKHHRPSNGQTSPADIHIVGATSFATSRLVGGHAPPLCIGQWPRINRPKRFYDLWPIHFPRLPIIGR
ncbi:hypothetical protein AVEN_23997-1 [Araneus ventricosus]|uniref:Uncharacterized protein n=1 Tax=Araneus ventricosus TaxID=182803 RepID=A0A4Y2CZZ1_ARAVE|nr:hypothetical protein AVEN_23997-1 [Araneus ventricosus]